MITRCSLIVILTISSPPLLAASDVDLWSHFKEESDIWVYDQAYVYTFELDVTGDGAPEVFLAHTGNSGRGGLAWVVYSPFGAGSYRALGQLVFSVAGFRYDTESSQLIKISGSSASRSIWASYRLDSGGIQEVAKEALTSQDELFKTSQEEFAAWRDETGLKVWVIELNELEDQENPVWINFFKRDEEKTFQLSGTVVQ